MYVMRFSATGIAGAAICVGCGVLFGSQVAFDWAAPKELIGAAIAASPIGFFLALVGREILSSDEAARQKAEIEAKLPFSG